MVVPVIHDVFTITHQVSINYITLNPVVRVGLREDEVSVIPGSLINTTLKNEVSVIPGSLINTTLKNPL